MSRFDERRQKAYAHAGLTSPTDEDVLRVMRDGGERLCEHAQTKHTSGACGQDEERNYAYYLWWNEVKEGVRETARRLRERRNVEEVSE